MGVRIALLVYCCVYIVAENLKMSQEWLWTMMQEKISTPHPAFSLRRGSSAARSQQYLSIAMELK